MAGIAAFNLDVEKPTVYSGPEGSYFGYSVDFHKPVQNRTTTSVLVGAPKANTSQPGIVEGGAVYYCPWPATDSDRCRQIPFDMTNNRMVRLNDGRIPIEFKSNQWFGATVRTYKEKVVACAPLYHWRTRKQDSEKDPVGTCYIAIQNFSVYAEYSPCRSSNPDPEGQGFCQAGFSVDFTKDGNLVVGGPGSFYWQDLIVGAFGAGKAVVYRARPVVTVDAELLLNPMILNPESKTCQLPNSATSVTCLTVRVCATVSGFSIPDTVALNAELHLDRLKQKGAIKRILFLENAQYQHTFQLLIEKRKPQGCQNFVVYLKDETEFRDKLTPISIGLNYSLDESNPPGGLTLKPILNYYREPFIHEQVYILVDCGEDNMCIPDLKLSARMDREQLIIGEENPLMLTINAQNQGEGAYESELHVLIPQEADYIGVERKNEALRQLNCEYRMENVTRMVVCDLGNPMVAGTNLSVGLRFAVQRLEEAGSDIKFDLQIKSSNKDNPRSNPISLQINITALAHVEIRGVSHPAQIFLPIHQWEPKDKPEKDQDIGPSVQHIYELHNKGPSAISNTFLEVGWPSHFRDEHLLYVLEIQTDGLINCRTNTTINQLNLETSALPDTPELLGFLRNSTVHSVRKREVTVPEPLRQYNAKTLNCSNISCLRIACHVVRLDKGQSAVVTVKSRLWAHTFLQRKNDPYSLHSTVSFKVMDMPYRIKPEKLPHASLTIKTLVLWATPDVSFAIPLWVIILAILLGLLVLAILTLVMWKGPKKS
ncbi:Integrin alpha-8 [Acipenser ruthenus]|uniref:Integrin alpha-8 n=1 Tax=Acipenser ruthenus TaxID=7906 RepID=A0A444U256_ACIRT|nr:Integrin alpha-8 [Acipenser ruthenus]